MTTTDDLARLVAIQTRDLVLSGRARQYRQSAGVTISELAKAAGATPEQVGLWEEGRLTPTVPQALAWLSLLMERASWREIQGKAGG